MNKNFFGLMAVWAAVMAAVGCTASGNPASMVGEWKHTTESSIGGTTVTYTTYMKIESDDKVYMGQEVNGEAKYNYYPSYRIRNRTCNSGKYQKYKSGTNELEDDEHKYEFEVTCNSLALTFVSDDGKSKSTAIYEKVQ